MALCVLGCASGDEAPAGEAPAGEEQPAAAPAAAEPEGAPAHASMPSQERTPPRAQILMPPEGFHLDDSSAAQRPQRPAASSRERRMIQITLKSTPSGSTAAVDGVSVGRTPALWEGEATGKPREFTFVLPGHAMARYRFVPTTDGIVHGTLRRLPSDAPAGTPASDVRR